MVGRVVLDGAVAADATAVKWLASRMPKRRTVHVPRPLAPVSNRLLADDGRCASIPLRLQTSLVLPVPRSQRQPTVVATAVESDVGPEAGAGRLPRRRARASGG